LCYLAEAWRLFDDRDLILFRFVLQHQELPTVWQSPLYQQRPDHLQVQPSHAELLAQQPTSLRR